MPMGCKLAAGVAGAQVLKILLNRGDVLNVPWGLHFDAFQNKFKKTWRPGGNNNILQKLAFKIAKKQLLTPQTEENKMPEYPLDTLAKKVLDHARWAPSGDNTQCWRFKLTGDNTFTVVANNTRDHVVYDSDGHSSHLAHGILIETIVIAASQFGHKAEYTSDIEDPDKLLFHFLLGQPAFFRHAVKHLAHALAQLPLRLAQAFETIFFGLCHGITEHAQRIRGHGGVISVAARFVGFHDFEPLLQIAGEAGTGRGDPAGTPREPD